MVFGVLGVIGIMVVLLIVVPVLAVVRVTGDGQPLLVVEMKLFGGLVSLVREPDAVFLTVGSWKRELQPRKTSGQEENETEQRWATVERFRSSVRRLEIARLKDRQAFMRMVEDVFAVLKVTVKGDVRYGMDDPAMVAWVYGLICMVSCSNRFAEFSVRPEFYEVGWWGSLELVCSVRLIDIFVPLASYGNYRVVKKIKANCFGGT